MTLSHTPRGYLKRRKIPRLVAFLFLSVGATTLASERVFAQQNYPAVGRPVPIVTRIKPPPRADKTIVAPSPSVIDPTSAMVVINPTSALGQALVACNQDEPAQETFALPGVKGEIVLNRCYKGRAHLNCVFAALRTEATSLTSSYTKIVDAKYPDLTSVDGICKINPDTLASDIVGSEDFAQRFGELKSQYEAATRCAANVEQAFKEVSLVDLTKAPEVLQSMTASLEGDLTKISKVQEQTADLYAKVELSSRAMKGLTKIHRAMCIKSNAVKMSGN